jgi:hypothetical protein
VIVNGETGNTRQINVTERGEQVAGITDKIQWHPGFYGAAELEFMGNKDDLEFNREYNLGKEPSRVDLLIVKKRNNAVIENEIGRIFKKYNVLEYKSPGDSLTIDDYYKTVGYACIYKGLGENVNEIPADGLTVSLFREDYPKKLIETLKSQGILVEEKFPGIYYLSGNTIFDTQIVVTGQLTSETHSSLRVLSKNVKEDDVRRFLTNTEHMVMHGDLNNADAVMQVSIAANRKVYDVVKEDYYMCEALRELMKDEIDREVEERSEKARVEALKEAREKARAEAREKEISLISNLMETMKLTAEQAMNALKIPAEERQMYASRLAK